MVQEKKNKKDLRRRKNKNLGPPETAEYGIFLLVFHGQSECKEIERQKEGKEEEKRKEEEETVEKEEGKREKREREW